MSSGNTERQIQFIRDLGSTILCCTPSYAAYLGETMQEHGPQPDEIPLKAGIFGAEAWTEEMRQDIQKKLGIKAYDIYGLTEISGPGVAFECAEQTGMHINEDHFIAEIIDPDTGEVLPEGSKGELVFTCITKEAFPLLRYRTRDICVLTREPCSCGRTHVKMTKPMGRSDDMLIIRGVNVFPSQIETVLHEPRLPGQLPDHRRPRQEQRHPRRLRRDDAARCSPTPSRTSPAARNSSSTASSRCSGIAVHVHLVSPKTIEPQRRKGETRYRQTPSGMI